jgi:hypothetical protein
VYSQEERTSARSYADLAGVLYLLVKAYRYGVGKDVSKDKKALIASK